MLSHDKIWLAIEKLAEIKGFSASGLARQAGLDPTTFNKSKRTSPDGKLRWPSTESISRILAATDTDISAFIALMEGDAAGARAESPGASSALSASSPALPMLVLDRAAHEGDFDAQGCPAGPEWKSAALFPEGDTGGHPVYMVEISGRGYAPFYQDGDRLILSASAPLRRGDRAMIARAAGGIVIAEVTRRTATRLAVRLSSGEEVAFSAPEILWAARVLWVGKA